MKTPRAIVIDDDEDTIEIFCEYLKLKNINVVGKGKDGLEAFKVYKETKPDIVLMDVMMPNYDGIFGLQKIKELDQESNVIMVTADQTKVTAEKLNALGADEILYKPYEINQVIKTINKLLSEKEVILAA